MLTVEQVQNHSELFVGPAMYISTGREVWGHEVYISGDPSEIIKTLKQEGFKESEDGFWVAKGDYDRFCELASPYKVVVLQWDCLLSGGRFKSYDEPFACSEARLLYLYGDRADKMRIRCNLPQPITRTEIESYSEEKIGATIDWERFTEWINKHDNLSEENLVDKDTWIACYSKQCKQGKVGRNGILYVP